MIQIARKFHKTNHFFENANGFEEKLTYPYVAYVGVQIDVEQFRPNIISWVSLPRHQTKSALKLQPEPENIW